MIRFTDVSFAYDEHPVLDNISFEVKPGEFVFLVGQTGSGKSTILDLLTYQMLVFGWRLYLADPQQHTFSPGLWNERIAMPVAGSHADMIKVLHAIESELATRVHLFQQAAQGGRPPKDIFLEFSMYISMEYRECQSSVLKE